MSDPHQGHPSDSPTSDVSYVRRDDIDSLVQALRGLDVPDAEVETFEESVFDTMGVSDRVKAAEWLEQLSAAVRSGTLPAASVAAETDREAWLDQIREALHQFGIM
jgi:hypothetical protein